MRRTSSTNRVTEAPHHVGYDAGARMAFFTDTSICIGCKACEVACKEWNRNPQDGGYEFSGMSYDNTGSLGANTWRHVAFIEQSEAQIERARAEGAQLISLGMPGVGAAGAKRASASVPHDTPDFRWLMSSDVCKHCTNAGCLDVCPTGALMRTEHGTVVVQDDVCNGCGTCVAGCPFGVIERRGDGGVSKRNERSLREGEDFTAGEIAPVKNIGVAQKCTMCFDRQAVGEGPACAKTCPTTSIKYGTYDEMLATAKARVAELHAQGQIEARLYGANSADGVGGTGSIFLLLDAPEVYGLPPDPEVPTANLPELAKRAAFAAAGLIGAAAAAFAIGGRG